MANRFLSNIQINDAYTFPASDGSLGQAIITDGAGNLSFGNVASGNTTLYQDNFTGNGATTDFTLANSVNNEIKTLVFLNGVYQFKDTYSVSGTTLSFDTAPANGTLIEVITIGSAASQADIDKLAGIEAGAQVNTLDGSGTANYVSKWSDADTITNSSIQDDGSTVSVGGNLAVDTNALFVDAANNWVGIGTSSPSRPIHILAPTPGIKLEDTTGNDFGEIVSVDGDLYIRADEGATQADSSIRFQIDQSERVRIDSSGNVGIGTSPDSDAELHVYRNASAARVRVEREFNPKLDLESLSGYAQIGTLNNFPLAFQTNGAERMRIDSSGNVAIGQTTEALAKLAVYGGRLYIDSTSEYSIRISNTGAVGGFIGTPASGALGFYGLTGTERMRIDSSGNVDVNGGGYLRVSPSTPPSIQIFRNANLGNNASAGSLNFGGKDTSDFAAGASISTITTGVWSPTSHPTVLLFSTTASGDSTTTERMRITSSGNVGIGTDAIGTNDKLLIKTSVDNSFAQGLVIQRSANTDEGYINYNGGGFQFRSTDGDPIVIGQVSNERMRIDSSGNVGIGISSPADKLVVIGDVASTGALKITGDSSTPSAGAFVHRPASNTLALGTASTERLRIDSSGNVGIGTTNANPLAINTNNAILTAEAAGGFAGNLQLGTSGVASDTNDYLGFLSFYSKNGGSGVEAVSKIVSQLDGAINSTNLQFQTESAGVVAERMRIESSGRVGIGTSSPAYSLDVQSSATTGIVAMFSNGANETSEEALIWITGQNKANYGVMLGAVPEADTPAVQDHAFIVKTNDSTGTDHTERFRISSDGLVGIGTQSPIAKAHIQGGDVIASLTDWNTKSNTAFSLANPAVRIGVGYNASDIPLIQGFDTSNAARNIGLQVYGGNAGIGTGTPAVKLDVAGQVRASTGILFGADTAAANALDDYEEGTWTMGIAFGGASVGVTFAANTGQYTKVGRKVTVTGQMVFTNKGSSTGGASITGLPFTSGSAGGFYGSAALRLENLTYTGRIQSYSNVNDTSIFLEELSEAGAASTITNSDFANNTSILLSLTYFTA
jgi:hypothetical protein